MMRLYGPSQSATGSLFQIDCLGALGSKDCHATIRVWFLGGLLLIVSLCQQARRVCIVKPRGRKNFKIEVFRRTFRELQLKDVCPYQMSFFFLLSFAPFIFFLSFFSLSLVLNRTTFPILGSTVFGSFFF